jgi:hypothetical protein
MWGGGLTATPEIKRNVRQVCNAANIYLGACLKFYRI